MLDSRNKISSAILIFIILSALNQARSQDSLDQLLNDDAQSETTQEASQPALPELPTLPTQPTAPQVPPVQQAPQPALPELPTLPAQPTAPQVPPAQQATNEATKKKGFHFFWVNKEKNEQKEKHKKEMEDLKNKQKQEMKDLKKKVEDEKVKEATFQKKVIEKQTESMLFAQKIIDERDKEVKEIKASNNTVEVITNKEDPLYIKKAQVLESKTKFMEIKDVEFKYKLELHNQTPKIINFVLITWERSLAFNDSQTLAKQVKVAKPIIPYEKRIVEYNELNSRRDGETYKVRIEKIVFEDGTQWKNPATKDPTL